MSSDTSLERESGTNRGYRYSELLDDQCAGQTLLEYLSRRYRHSSEDTWRGHITDGRVLIDGEPVRDPKHPLSPGHTLVWARPPWREPEAPGSFALLYKDADVLGVAKPRGLPTLPGGGFLEQTLLGRLRRAFPEASPLHRLGRGTSGVVLCSRHRTSRRKWTSLWPQVSRTYRGLVEGRFPPGETRVDAPIGTVPHPLLGRLAAVAADGKPAVSLVRLLEHRGAHSLVEVRIETGRTHQIRIHLAAAGYPLAGDPLYLRGGVPSPGDDTLPGISGYWLHAERVELGQLTIECVPPPVLRLGAGD